jgi:hypothetical protein
LERLKVAEAEKIEAVDAAHFVRYTEIFHTKVLPK